VVEVGRLSESRKLSPRRAGYIMRSPALRDRKLSYAKSRPAGSKAEPPQSGVTYAKSRPAGSKAEPPQSGVYYAKSRPAGSIKSIKNYRRVSQSQSLCYSFLSPAFLGGKKLLKTNTEGHRENLKHKKRGPRAPFNISLRRNYLF
jgi:hypothetical protein